MMSESKTPESGIREQGMEAVVIPDQKLNYGIRAMMQERISREELDRAFDARFPKEMRRKLRGGRVAVAGLGGLGSNIAVMLARSGVGTNLRFVAARFRRRRSKPAFRRAGSAAAVRFSPALRPVRKRRRGLFLSEDARVFPIRPPFGVMPAPPGSRGSLPARAVVASIRARASSVAAMARGAPSGVFPRRFASSEHFQLENAPEVERSDLLLFSAYP